MDRLKSIKMKAGQKSSDTRVSKPPKPPEKPLMPYMRYSRKVWESVKNANPLLKLWEVGKIIGQMWRELPENEKSHFVEEYENDKIQYNDALRMYHNSPAYKSWLLHKEKMDKNVDDNDSLDSISQSQLFKQNERLAKEAHNVESRESYILEDNDEDPDEIFTVKHIAAQRFQRNHKFMLDLFSDTKIPELGSIVTESRLSSLKQQVNGLLTHKRKFDEEIEDWSKKHESKKLKIKCESESFWMEYNKELEARPVITETMFSDMVKRARDDIIREEKERDEFIKMGLNVTERKTSIGEHLSENSSKSDTSVVELPNIPLAQFDTNSKSDIASVPNPFTASVVNKPQISESQGSQRSLTPVTFTELPQNMLGPPFMEMSQRNFNNSYDNRSISSNYGYGQQTQPSIQPPQNQLGNYPPGRYPQSCPPRMSQHSSQQSTYPQLSSPQPVSQYGGLHSSKLTMQTPNDSFLNELDQKPPKLTKTRDAHSPNIDKETHLDPKITTSKDKSDSSFNMPKISDIINCPSNTTPNSKAPILSPKVESDAKVNFHESSDAPTLSIQTPVKKPSSKRRRPPANKSKTSSKSQALEMDAMTPESVSGGSTLMNASHISPGPKVDPSYQGDPNFSQMPSQGLYPYHYYPPQFVQHNRTPAPPYGSPYQQGFNQPNYYNPLSQPGRQITASAPAPHQQIQGDLPVNQYGTNNMQHKSMPQQPNQPYPANPFGISGNFPGYGAAGYGGTGQPYTNSQQDVRQNQAIPHKEIPISQSAPMSHMNVPDDMPKYQSEASVSGPVNQGFSSPQVPPMSQPGYPSQYPGLPYTNPPSTTQAHYPAMQPHYFYYPPGGGPPANQPPSADHAFWAQQQQSQSHYSSLPPPNIVDNNPDHPKVQE